MNALPIELQNIIYSYVGKHKLAHLFDKVIECRENDPDQEDDFYTWWKDQFKLSDFNPTRHLHVLSCGDHCVRCQYWLTWDEYQTEGYDGMCARCYQRVYHPDADDADEYNLNHSDDEEDEYEEDEY